MKAICHSDSESETMAIGEALAKPLAPDGVLLLSGDLGSGKTVLTRGLAAGLGIDASEVQSPTFTLMREHHGIGGDLIHIDLYRLDGEELAALGLWEILAGPGVKAVEWAERLPFPIPQALRVSMQVIEVGNRREIEVVVWGRELESQFHTALRSLSARLA